MPQTSNGANSLMASDYRFVAMGHSTRRPSVAWVLDKYIENTYGRRGSFDFGCRFGLVSRRVRRHIYLEVPMCPAATPCRVIPDNETLVGVSDWARASAEIRRVAPTRRAC